MRLKIGVFLAVFLVLLSSAFAVTTTLYNEIDSNADLDPSNTVLSFMKKGTFVVVNLLNQQPDPVEPGEYVELTFKIENEGPDVFYGATFEIVPEYPFSLDESEQARKYVGDLKGRSVNDNALILRYKMRVAEDAIEGYNPIKLRYISSDELWREDTRWTYTDEFDVKVETPDAVLSVNKIISDPERIKPGETSKLTIQLENLADSVIRSITAKLEIDGTDFAVVGSSNEKTIQSLNGKEVGELEFYLVANYDIDSKVHKINLMLDYEDSNDNMYSKNLTIGLPVFDVPSYLLNLEETKIYTKNQKGDVVVSLSNIGSGMIRFATLELIESEDYKILSVPNVYLGNLESDDFETSQYTIYSSTTKEELPLKLRLTFKDDFNKEYVIDETVKLDMFSSREAKKFGLIKQKSMIGLIIFILIILVIAWFVYRRWEKKRRKK